MNSLHFEIRKKLNALKSFRASEMLWIKWTHFIHFLAIDTSILKHHLFGSVFVNISTCTVYEYTSRRSLFLQTMAIPKPYISYIHYVFMYVFFILWKSKRLYKHNILDTLCDIVQSCYVLYINLDHYSV